jgi:hypothetical protein
MADDANNFFLWGGVTLKQIDAIREQVADMARSLMDYQAYALPTTALKGRDHQDKRDQLSAALQKVTDALREVNGVLDTLTPDANSVQ